MLGFGNGDLKEASQGCQIMVSGNQSGSGNWFGAKVDTGQREAIGQQVMTC